MTSIPRTRRAAYRAIAPEFRRLLLRLPFDITNESKLRMIRRFNATASKQRTGVTAERRSIPARPSLTAIVHDPAHRPASSGAVLWLFGGGLISGTAAHVSADASRFAAELDALVVVPDYALAPEHPYPAAIDDCFATLIWMIENASDLGIDPTRIIVGGESAGAGLAAALSQRAHDVGISIALQVLVAPMLDDRTVPRAEAEGRVVTTWTVPSNRFAWTSYLGHAPGEAESRPYAVPARRDDLSGLAPAWISVGDVDLFHQEAVEYAQRLEAGGVPVELITVPGAHHGWELMTPKQPRVIEVQSARIAAMRAALEA